MVKTLVEMPRAHIGAPGFNIHLQHLTPASSKHTQGGRRAGSGRWAPSSSQIKTHTGFSDQLWLGSGLVPVTAIADILQVNQQMEALSL